MADSPIQCREEWPLVSLGAVATKIGSGSTPRGGAETYLARRARFALVRSQNVFDRRFDVDSVAFISDAQAEALRGVALQSGDILLNITGDGVTFGRACLVPERVLPACVNQHVAIIRLDRAKAVPGYVLAYLTHPLVKRYIESFNAGGSRRAITKGHIESFALPLAPLREQRRIAQILGSLDDKIELNRQMNETLEAMARAIFKSWFVDFDPVRAKQEGRDPFGMDAETAALFPDSFQQSELGPIPKGWSVEELGTFMAWSRTQTKPQEQLDTQFLHFSIPAFDSDRMPKVELGADIRSNKFLVPDGAVLVSKLNPSIPRVWLADLRGDMPAVSSTELLVAIPRAGVPRHWLYCVLSSRELREWMAFRVTGTSNSHQRVRPADIEAFKLIAPSSPILNAFERVVEPILQRIALSRRENQTLAELRDTLLPKLISGELRLPEAEELAEAAQ